MTKKYLTQQGWNELDALISKAYSCISGDKFQEARENIVAANVLRAEMASEWRASQHAEPTCSHPTESMALIDRANDGLSWWCSKCGAFAHDRGKWLLPVNREGSL
jgi:hypothetical protein